jgi:hypothetical protein
MADFLTAIRKGATQEDAARAAGFSRSAFARLCRRDPVFAGHYADALSFSSGPLYVSRGAGRPLQLRRNRRVTFTDVRKEAFLDHFAGTANLARSAEVAGVCQATVFKHLRSDEAFAARFREALGIAHLRLEADVAQRRIKGQQRLKEIEPKGEPEPEFDRAIKLLQRWDRRAGQIGRREVRHGHKVRWAFDDAIRLLARRLLAMDKRAALPPASEGEEGGE